MGLRQLPFSDGGWIDLRREDATHSVRRVYVSEDIFLPLHSKQMWMSEASRALDWWKPKQYRI